jgi:hypothetical protein
MGAGLPGCWSVKAERIEYSFCTAGHCHDILVLLSERARHMNTLTAKCNKILVLECRSRFDTKRGWKTDCRPNIILTLTVQLVN